jgi:hypothetical protein
VKSVSERPNAWYVFVSIVAFFYWSYFGWSLLYNTWLACHSEYQDAYPRFGVEAFLILLVVVFLPIEIYLVRDLIRQVSLFFQGKTK